MDPRSCAHTAVRLPDRRPAGLAGRRRARSHFREGEELLHEGEPAVLWWVLRRGRRSPCCGRRLRGHRDGRAWTQPGQLGRRLRRVGRRSGVYLATGRGDGDGRVFTRAGRRPAAPGRRVVPVRRALHQRATSSTVARHGDARPRSARHSWRSARWPRGWPTSSTTRRPRRPGPSTRSSTTSARMYVGAEPARRPSDDRRAVRRAGRAAPGAPAADATRGLAGRADREDALARWLADHGVARTWLLAPPLAAAGRRPRPGASGSRRVAAR